MNAVFFRGWRIAIILAHDVNFFLLSEFYQKG
jgi:hypothetical protein